MPVANHALNIFHRVLLDGEEERLFHIWLTAFCHTKFFFSTFVSCQSFVLVLRNFLVLWNEPLVKFKFQREVGHVLDPLAQIAAVRSESEGEVEAILAPKLLRGIKFMRYRVARELGLYKKLLSCVEHGHQNAQ